MLAIGAILAAVTAVWVTLEARFLAYPGWLAVQKGDFILGPIGVGLYWHYRRPNNRLGVLLIALGLLGVPYILESTSTPLPFSIGVLTEYLIFPMTLAVILAFPSGRLDGLPERLILFAVLVGVTLPGFVLAVTSARFAPSFSISGCRAPCPVNALELWSPAAWEAQLVKAAQLTAIVTALAAAGLFVSRFATGTPPRRRALAVGAPIALLFLLMQASYRLLDLLSPHGLSLTAQPVHDVIQWTFAGARAAVWYGFLFALIAAELFAGRVLREVVRSARGRPSIGELEQVLRDPLGDPKLRLGFWRPATSDWADADGAVLDPRPGSGQAVTEVRRDGQPAAVIVHDKQLTEDPELLETAGAVALMALENAELDIAWKKSLHDLVESRARLAEAGDRERRKLERDLHDGAQQRLMGVQIKLRVAQEQVDDRSLHRQLEAIGAEAAEAVEELRTLAHGIYPPVLRSGGLVRALRSLAMRAAIPVTVTDEGIGRSSASVEAAVYFCAMEAVQNATKHAGSDVRVAVILGRDRERVTFAISDDGVGIDRSAGADGDGLIGMRDRVGAVGGELEIVSARGKGTTVRGTIPIPSGAEAQRVEAAS